MSTILTKFKLFVSGLECLALPNFYMYTLRCPSIYLVRNTSEQFHKFMILLRESNPLRAKISMPSYSVCIILPNFKNPKYHVGTKEHLSQEGMRVLGSQVQSPLEVTFY